MPSGTAAVRLASSAARLRDDESPDDVSTRAHVHHHTQGEGGERDPSRSTPRMVSRSSLCEPVLARYAMRRAAHVSPLHAEGSTRE
jgi:hypothetical protein